VQRGINTAAKSTGDFMADEKIVMAHGGGGVKMHELINKHILSKLSNPFLNSLSDSAVLNIEGKRICFTTDGFVVWPLEFPGGDIGKLAVCGTVNDLAVMGAVPLALSLSLIIEEGFDLAVLDRIITSIAETAKLAGVNIVTGDTKVIERARGDGLTITTSGIGILPDGVDLNINKICAGDVIIFSGNIAEHGLAIMSAREGLAFKTTIKTDAAPLNLLTKDLIGTGLDIKFMRDPTRGGLAGVLADIVESVNFAIEVNEADIPITPSARHAAELLGLDPLTIANEGKCVIVVSQADAEKVLAICKKNPLGKDAAIIAKVVDKKPAIIELKTRAGGKRLIQRPYGEELPRIC
jgi:hydrogenase expression/formation protein HypE